MAGKAGKSIEIWVFWVEKGWKTKSVFDDFGWILRHEVVATLPLYSYMVMSNHEI